MAASYGLLNPVNAHLETNFRRGFLLSEENLIKLTDIISKRLAPIESDAKVLFKVYSIDGMLLELDTPSSVAAQENSSRNAVKETLIKPSLLGDICHVLANETTMCRF